MKVHPNYSEREIELMDLIQECWAWLGVAAPRNQKATRKYMKMVKNVAAVVRENKVRKEMEE
tara:strand:+ start:1317 stop:1502 length:186 start_codon:yes stop_codon:yes gene_type:complete